MPKKSRVRKSKRMGHRGGVMEQTSTSSTSTSNEPSWTEKFTNFFKKITGPDANREDTSASITPSSPTPSDTSTAKEKLDKFTTIVGAEVDKATSTVSDMTTRASTTVSDLFKNNNNNTNNSGESGGNPMHNQGGGKSRRRKRRTTARSTIRANISKKITKIVNMVKNRMTCKNKHKKGKRNYKGGSSVSYYGSYPNSVGKINVPVPPK